MSESFLCFFLTEQHVDTYLPYQDVHNAKIDTNKIIFYCLTKIQKKCVYCGSHHDEVNMSRKLLSLSSIKKKLRLNFKKP